MGNLMPIGVEDFQELRLQGYYFVDKTDFIRQLLTGHSKVTLITRPRRFGKTLTMSMLDWFFSNEKEKESRNLFQGLAIDKTVYTQQRGQYPVIFISLKDFSALSWDEMLDEWREFLQSVFLQHTNLRDVARVQEELITKFQAIIEQKANVASLSTALSLLLHMMHQYYEKKVILLLDEYDAPLELAWEQGYYPQCIAFMRRFLGSALKTNMDLDFAVLTGVLRIAKESIFSGLNNLDVCSLFNHNYADIFGFTPAEVAKMAKDLQAETYVAAIKRWYDGYHIGGQEIYNPWSVINFFKNRILADYWINTSSNGIIRHMLQHLDTEKSENLLCLLQGKSIIVTIREGIIYDDIDRDEDALYTLLLTTGYLTAADKHYGLGGTIVEAVIPNREVQDIFRLEIIERFRANLSITRLGQMLHDLLYGQAEAFSQKLAMYIRYLVSSHDAANKESFYHGLLLGMTALLVPDYIVESNRESGYGRFDLAIFPKDIKKAGVILEFKAADTEIQLERKAEEALQQIQRRQYITEFEKRGIITVWKYGIAFWQKKVCVKRGK